MKPPGGMAATQPDLGANQEGQSQQYISVAMLASRLTCTIPEAAQLLGIGRDAAYAAAHRGEIPTLAIGRRLIVPVPRLLELLGISPDMSEDRAPTRSTATTNAVTEGPRHDNNPTLRAI